MNLRARAPSLASRSSLRRCPAISTSLSRPLTYLEWSAASADGREHQIEIYFDAAADLVVNTPDQTVTASRYRLDGMPVLRSGSREQPVLAKRGDDLRIDWGYLYLAADQREGVTEYAGDRNAARTAFDATGRLPESDEFGEPRRAGPVLAFAIAIGQDRRRPAVALPDAGLRRSLRDRVLPAPRARLVAAQWRRGRRPAAQRAPRSRFAARRAARRSTPN